MEKILVAHQILLEQSIGDGVLQTEVYFLLIVKELLLLEKQVQLEFMLKF